MSYKKNVDKIEEIELGNKFPLTKGELYCAKSKSGKDCFVKVIPKSLEDAKVLYKSERMLYEKIISESLIRLVSVFKDDKNYYLLFNHFEGEKLLSSIDDPKSVGRQLYILISKMHKSRLFFSSEKIIETAFLTDKMRLGLAGFNVFQDVDSDEEQLKEKLMQDWFIFGVFLYTIIIGKSPLNSEGKVEDSVYGDIPSDVRDVVFACLRKTTTDPIQYEYLQPEVVFKLKDDKRLILNDFYIDWESGIKVGFRNSEFGYDDSKFSFTSGSSGITISTAGSVELSSEFTDDFYDEKVKRSLTISGEGVKMSQELLNETIETEIGANGFKTGSKGKSIGLGPNGFEYREGEYSLCISDNYENTFPDPKPPVFGQPSYFYASDLIAKIDKSVFGLNFHNFLYFLITTEPSLYFWVSGTTINLGPEGLEIRVGPDIALIIGSNGVRFNIGEFIVEINGDGLRIEAVGFVFKCGKGGFQFENCDKPIDLAAYNLSNLSFPTIQIKLEKINIPGIPKLPPIPKPIGMPSIPSPSIKLPFGGKKENKSFPPGKVEDFINDGETLVKKALVTRVRYAGLSKHQRMLILTSTHRIIYATPTLSKSKGELLIGKESTVEPKAETKLLLTSNTGKKYTFIYENESARNEWKSTISDIIANP